MASLLSISIKGKDGNYKEYTVSIDNETNKFGQNVSMYEAQTKDQREAKVPRNFIGNGKVFWTDGNISVADKVEREGKSSQSQFDDTMPF